MTDQSELQSNVRFLPDSGRRAYETEAVATIISLFARPGMPQPGIPDSDRDNEDEAMRITFATVEHCLADLERAACLSELRRNQLNELRDAILDNMPTRLGWQEAISGARRGY